MAEGRMLKKKISTDVDVADLENPWFLVLFTWGISHLDIEGRITGDPREYKAIVTPLLDKINKDVVLAFFEKGSEIGLIQRYEVGGKWAVQFPGFKKNQSLRPDKEGASIFPAPPKDGPLPDNSGTTPGPLPDNSGTTPAERKLSKEKLKEDKERIAPPAPGNGDARPQFDSNESNGAYSSDFLLIYSAYPKNQRGSKKNAYVQFKKLKAQIPPNITEIIERQIREKKKADALGIFYPEFKHLERWLKAQAWENEPFDFNSGGGDKPWYE